MVVLSGRDSMDFILYIILLTGLTRTIFVPTPSQKVNF